MNKKKIEKLKFGFFSFTCCEGCMVVFVEALNKKFEEWMKKMQIENFRALKSVKPTGKMDYAIVEGSISTASELKKLKEIRKKSKFLIALGSGASNGYPSNQRNSFTGEKLKEIKIKTYNQLDKIMPLKEYVKVDEEINGCPVDEKVLIEKIDSYLNKK